MALRPIGEWKDNKQNIGRHFTQVEICEGVEGETDARVGRCVDCEGVLAGCDAVKQGN